MTDYQGYNSRNRSLEQYHSTDMTLGIRKPLPTKTLYPLLKFSQKWTIENSGCNVLLSLGLQYLYMLNKPYQQFSNTYADCLYILFLDTPTCLTLCQRIISVYEDFYRNQYGTRGTSQVTVAGVTAEVTRLYGYEAHTSSESQNSLISLVS